MADGYSPYTPSPLLGGLFAGLQQLPGIISGGMAQRRQEKLEQERRQLQGIQTLAEILKLPVNMQGPMLEHAGKSLGVDPTILATVQKANEEQRATLRQGLLSAGATGAIAELYAGLSDPKAALPFLTSLYEQQRTEKERRRVGALIEPPAEARAPEPGSLAELVTPPAAPPAPEPMPAPPPGPQFAAIPPAEGGAGSRLDIDPSIGPPGAEPGGGFAPGTLGAVMTGARQPFSLFGGPGPSLEGPEGPVAPPSAAIAPPLVSRPTPAPMAPPGPAPVTPGAPETPVAKLTGPALGAQKRYQALQTEMERVSGVINRLTADGSPEAMKRAEAFQKQLDSLDKQARTALDALDKNTPGWGERYEMPDPQNPGQWVLAQSPSKGEGPPRILGPAPPKLEKVEVQGPRGPETQFIDPRTMKPTGPGLAKPVEPGSPEEKDLVAAVQSGDQGRIARAQKRLDLKLESEGLEPAERRARIQASQASAASAYASAAHSRASTQKVLAEAAEGKAPKASDVAGMRKEFTAQSQPYVQTRDAFRRMEAAGAGPAGDIALIYAYMKILDPGSVVREGEFATAQNAGGIPEAVRGMLNRAIGAGRLTDVQRQQFRAEVGRLHEAQRRSHQQLVNEYTGIAQRARVDPRDVVVDLQGGATTPAAPPPDLKAAGNRLRESLRR